MSPKELKRAEVLGRVKDGVWTLHQAATRLDVSYRQVRRLWQRYRRRGARGLVHGNVGKRSNRAAPPIFWRTVLDRVETKYGGDAGHAPFGPTLAAEHLASEDGLVVTRETLRRRMVTAGLWTRVRKPRPHRRRRERKAHFGELLQLDGSFEAWLEDRGPRACLMNLVDDATGTCLVRFEPEETTWAAVHILRAWIEHYGVPHTLYTDWKTVYLREPTDTELAAGTAPLTQFGRMCATLGIRIVGANSPQAKGRVERHHGTHQDRLIKKLRRLGIRDYRAANAYLVATYLDDHNRRFARSAPAAEDFHLAMPPGLSLDTVFWLEQVRTISNDWVVRYENRLFQVQRQSRFAPARAKVLVREDEGGTVQIVYRDQVLRMTEITGRGTSAVDHPAVAVASGARPAGRPARPGPDHPWKTSYRRLPDHVSPGESIPGYITPTLGLPG